MPTLDEFKVHVGVATTYNFQFKEPFGWAIFTVNDLTGEFQVQSDWGQWQFRWNVTHLGEAATNSGKPLTHFLAVRPDPAYVLDKFSYNKPKTFTQEFSLDETTASMKANIIEQRRETTLSRDEARELWGQVERWEKHHPGDSEAAIVMSLNDMRECQPDLYEFLGGDFDIWEHHLEHKASWEYVFLRHKLLPMFFDYLRNEVLHVDIRGESVKETA